MRRIFSIILSVVMLILLLPNTHAASDEATTSANSLYQLGLFEGVGKDDAGNPIFDLDRAPTRHEAVTMLVRLLGKGEKAESGVWNTPFIDVADWAKPYVGYAYANGLTSSTSGTTYGGSDLISATQYLTFVLRALGYESGTDFQWDKAWELSDKIGLTNGQFNDTDSFTRGDVAIISYNALKMSSKNSDVSLIQTLDNCLAVTPSAALSSLLSSYGGIEYYDEYSVLPKVENVNLRATLEKGQPSSPGATYFLYKYPFDYEYEANSTCELYRSFLQTQGFSIQNTGNSYKTEYTATVPSTGKSFTFYIHQIAQSEPWYLNISIPIDDVIINEDTYDTYFYLSDSSITVDRLGTATLTATVKSTDSIRIEWDSFDEKIVLLGQQKSVVKDGYTAVSIQIGGIQSGSTFVSATLYENNEMYDMAMCWVEVPVDIQKSPVKITNISSKMNSVGGTTFTFDVTNNGTKPMKYISIYWRCLNAVGDYLYDTISWDDRFAVRITGPLNPGNTLRNLSNTRPFYNYDFANKIEMIEIVITYMDDSVEVVNPTNYIDYWDLD